MKTVTGRVVSEEPIPLSKAAKILSRFVSSKNEASQDVSAYLRRASAAFNELKGIHRDVNSSSPKETRPRSDSKNERNRTDEFEELGRAKGMDDLVGKGGKIRSRKSETVSEEVSVCGREHDEIKEEKKEKKKKKKSKKNREEDVAGEKVKEKLEDEQSNEERKEKKKEKKKRKKNKEEDVIDEKVNEKLEEEQRKGERKSDGEVGSEERKSKKKRKLKEIDG